MIDLLTPHITPSTILGGDFNCVTNIAMDTSRDAKSPYNNTGSDKINTSIEVNNLCDDVRTTLGVGFAHTHAQQVHFKDVNGQPKRGVCLVRIDRIYTPDIPETLLTSHIKWDLFDSDHAAIIYEFAPTSDIERGHDLQRIDAKLILDKQINKTLRTII